MRDRLPDDILASSREKAGDLRAAGVEKAGVIRAAGVEKASDLRDAGVEKASELMAAGAELRTAGVEKAAELRTASVEKASEIRAAGAEKVSEVRAASAEMVAKVKPRLRGYVHQYAFFVALAMGAGLVAFADGAKAKVAALVYAVSLAGLLGTSALYHRVTWSEVARKRMRRLDHSMIFVLIAGTTTPIALFAVKGTFGIVLLSVAWGIALAGIVMKMVWITAPKWVSSLVYGIVGSVGIVAIGSIAGSIGLVAVGCLMLGGALYGVGATVYALERPNPVPNVFGYHEVFHVLVVVAAALQFGVIAGWVLPLGA